MLEGQPARAEGEEDGGGEAARRQDGKVEDVSPSGPQPRPPQGASPVSHKASALSPSFVDSAMVLEVLASLIDKSLVQQQSWEGEARFVMLEMIRVFAWNQLVA